MLEPGGTGSPRPPSPGERDPVRRLDDQEPAGRLAVAAYVHLGDAVGSWADLGRDAVPGRLLSSGAASSTLNTADARLIAASQASVPSSSSS